MVILAVDLGRARTGLAVSDEGERLASPLGVVSENGRKRLAGRVAEAARESGAGLLVVGLPRNMDGSEGASAQAAREIGALLEDVSGLPVVYWDERGTTVTAHGYLSESNVRGKKRKAAVDAVAATVILQSYLDSKRLSR